MKNWIEILEGNYFGDSGAGAIIQAKDTGRILVVRRSSRVNEPLTYSIVLSGKIDAEEDPYAAAKREVKEETGYTGKILKSYIIDVFTDENDNEQWSEIFTFTTYKFVVPHEFDPKINWETQSVFWWDGKRDIKGQLHFGTKSLLKKYYNKIFRNN